MNTPYDREAIKLYILSSQNFLQRELRGITDGALTETIHKVDDFLRYICNNIARQHARHYSTSDSLTLDMVRRISIFKPDLAIYDDIGERTCFDQQQIKHRIIHFIGKHLNITDDAYFKILEMLHKRFDDMIELAFVFTTCMQSRTIKKRSVELGAFTVKMCLVE
jgi:hypothetical protein